jgi:hypothetical protein
MTTGRINQVAHPRRHARTVGRPATVTLRGRGSKAPSASGPSSVRERQRMPNRNREEAGRPGAPRPLRPQHPKAQASPQRPIDTEGFGMPPFERRQGTLWGAPLRPGGEGSAVQAHKRLGVPTMSGSVHRQRDGSPRHPRSSAQRNEGTAAAAVGYAGAGSPPRHADPKPLTCRHGRSHARPQMPTNAHSPPNHFRSEHACGRSPRHGRGSSAEHEK